MHQVHGRVVDEGKIPIFFPDVLPPVVSSPASPSSGVGVQLRWAKAWPCHGGCPSEVNVVAGRLQLVRRSSYTGERRCGGCGGGTGDWWCARAPRRCYGLGERVEGAPGALNASGHGGRGKAEAVALRRGAVRQRRAPVGFILG